MATVRRLSNQDVISIFDCVHNNRIPRQRRLAFKIVVVGPHGMKLSPPSYQFEDGLYILLKPLKKNKGAEKAYSPQSDVRIPPNLKHCVFTETPQQSCPWSLSGPQFPTPTAIQQRYCYPKGDLAYSNVKGGALWTCYDEDGREDLEYRLLHVYYSAKRAGNKSGSIRQGIVTDIHALPPVGGNSALATVTPTAKKRKMRSKKMRGGSPSRSIPTENELMLSPSFDSPLSFDMPPVSPIKEQSLSWLLNVTSDENKNETEEQFITSDRDYPQGSFQSVSNNAPFTSRHDHQHRPRETQQYSHQPNFHRMDDSHYVHNMGQYHHYRNQSQYQYGASKDYIPPREHYHYRNMPPPVPYHSHSMVDANNSSFEVGSVSSWGETPLSSENPPYPIQQKTESQSPSENNISDFVQKLQSIHEDIKNQIKQESKEADKGRLVSFLSSWARSVSLNPLGFVKEEGELAEDHVDNNCTAV